MRSSHTAARVDAAFDDVNLVSQAGLVPVMRLAQRAGLGEAADRLVRLPGSVGAHAGAKVGSIVAGMVAGADSIEDLDVLRHGGLPRLFTGVRAPSTLGTFLRSFTWGHVRQVDALARHCVASLAQLAPGFAATAGRTVLDLDSTIARVFGYAKQGAEYGYTRQRGLHPLLAVASTESTAPVIVGTRLRRGAAGSGKAAAGFLTEALSATRAAGASGEIVVRADSAFYSAAVIAACLRAEARFSITTVLNPTIRAAIASIPETAWIPIAYPQAIYDEQTRQWISDAEVAETTYTAFNNRTTNMPVTARLIVRRVKDKNVDRQQSELFTAWRYHACFTNSNEDLITAEARHRGHAIVEQVIADLKDSALAHLPSGKFTANAVWLTCAAIAHNLTRAAAALASVFHAKARTGTIRRHLINVPARIARSARRILLHLPAHWRWQHAFTTLFYATHDPPAA
ncbi:IS1380 family transposase [Saccharopolyspora sp. NPDC049426]|uniref:IS1380 family transposase n=1 Tax=Saccharopolyspora sp. NPDC049426 TaxID=3155652 RepID=UPI003448D398